MHWYRNKQPLSVLHRQFRPVGSDSDSEQDRSWTIKLHWLSIVWFNEQHTTAKSCYEWSTKCCLPFFRFKAEQEFELLYYWKFSHKLSHTHRQVPPTSVNVRATVCVHLFNRLYSFQLLNETLCSPCKWTTLPIGSYGGKSPTSTKVRLMQGHFPNTQSVKHVPHKLFVLHWHAHCFFSRLSVWLRESQGLEPLTDLPFVPELML